MGIKIIEAQAARNFGTKEKCKEYRHRLSGKIHLVIGNHDYKNKIHTLGNLFTEISPLITINHQKHRIILCHYAMRTWDASHYNSYQLYGHSHGMLDGIGKQMDVGVDTHPEFRPYSFDEIAKIMKTKTIAQVDGHKQGADDKIS